MPLSFMTKNQQFVIVDAVTKKTVGPGALQENRLYEIFLVVENTDSVESPPVQVSVSHSAFGIGRGGATDGLTQPAPVAVPPQEYAIPGTATVAFTLLTPSGGFHACLYAKLPSPPPDQPYIQQNIDVLGVPIGVASKLSFLVFGSATETVEKGTVEKMVLTLTESVQNGAAVPPGSAQSWKPLLIAPASTGPAGPTAAPVTLTLEPDKSYSVGLQLSPPGNANAVHVFHVVGTVDGQYVGEADLVVNLKPPALLTPDPYVHGTWESPDILLFDQQNNPVPMGATPAADTLLLPNTDYKLAVVVHNSSPTPAVNTVVRFWRMAGGVGTYGTLIDVRTVTVPGFGSVQVNSGHPFHSAPVGQSICAAVSIYNAQSLHATVDPVVSTLIPSPYANVEHSSSAWRNTESIWVFIGKPWTFTVAAPIIGHEPPLPHVTATAVRVAAGFDATHDAVNLRQVLQQAGARTVYPLYLTPTLRAKLPAADLKIRIAEARPVTLTHAEAAPIAAHEFHLSGTVPADAKVGDIFLVRIAAKYADRTVEFLLTLHVKAD